MITGILMEKNMIANVIEEVSKYSKVPSKKSKDFVEFAYTVKECANLDSKIKLVNVDNFAMARNSYGYVKYLSVIWSVDKDYVGSDFSEEKLFEIQEFIYKNLCKKMHWDNSDLNVFVVFDPVYTLELQSSGEYLITALVKEICDWQP